MPSVHNNRACQQHVIHSHKPRPCEKQQKVQRVARQRICNRPQPLCKPIEQKAPAKAPVVKQSVPAVKHKKRLSVVPLITALLLFPKNKQDTAKQKIQQLEDQLKLYEEKMSAQQEFFGGQTPPVVTKEQGAQTDNHETVEQSVQTPPVVAKDQSTQTPPLVAHKADHETAEQGAQTESPALHPQQLDNGKSCSSSASDVIYVNAVKEADKGSSSNAISEGETELIAPIKFTRDQDGNLYAKLHMYDLEDAISALRNNAEMELHVPLREVIEKPKISEDKPKEPIKETGRIWSWLGYK